MTLSSMQMVGALPLSKRLVTKYIFSTTIYGSLLLATKLSQNVHLSTPFHFDRINLDHPQGFFYYCFKKILIKRDAIIFLHIFFYYHPEQLTCIFFFQFLTEILYFLTNNFCLESFCLADLKVCWKLILSYYVLILLNFCSLIKSKQLNYIFGFWNATFQYLQTWNFLLTVLEIDSIDYWANQNNHIKFNFFLNWVSKIFRDDIMEEREHTMKKFDGRDISC